MVVQSSAVGLSNANPKAMNLRHLQGVARQIACLGVPLAILTGSVYVLFLCFASGWGAPVCATAALAGVIGISCGLFYSVENMRRLLAHEDPRLFFFGVDNQIAILTPRERLALIFLADGAYSYRSSVARPRLTSAIGSIATLKGLFLVAAGALAVFGIRHSCDWWMAGGALLALVAPYLISVLYDFCCSYMDRYAFHSEFARNYLQSSNFQKRRATELAQAAPESEFLLPVRAAWGSFSLQFPVVSGIVAFALVRAQVIFWALIVSLAVVPLIGIDAAATSVLEPFSWLLGGVGWEGAYERCFELTTTLSEWNLPHTVADLIRLSLIAYGLGILALPRQLNSSGVGRVIATVSGFLSGDFWRALFHIWIIAAGIGAALRFAEMLAQLH